MNRGGTAAGSNGCWAAVACWSVAKSLQQASQAASTSWSTAGIGSGAANGSRCRSTANRSWLVAWHRGRFAAGRSTAARLGSAEQSGVCRLHGRNRYEAHDGQNRQSTFHDSDLLKDSIRLWVVQRNGFNPESSGLRFSLPELTIPERVITGSHFARLSCLLSERH